VTTVHLDVRERLHTTVEAARSSSAGRSLESSRAWAFLRTFAANSKEDRVPGLAAETAFFVVLGIFPALLIAAGLLGVLDVVVGPGVATAAKDQVINALNSVLTKEAAPAVASVENLFENRRGRLLTVATLSALVTLSGAFAVAVNALNLAYGATESRSWIHRRLLGLAMGAATVVAGTIALALLVVGPLLGQGRDLADLVGLGAAFTFAWDVLRLPAVAVGLVLWTATLLHIAPNRAQRWRDSLPGALLTTVLWLAASVGLHLYLVLAADANPVLGAFGGGVIVLIWVYLLSVALLLGGELNALRCTRRRSGGDRSSG
jgi:membrane protein